MHHSRRRSGHGLPNTSMTDVRKAATANENGKSKMSSRQNASSRRNASGTSQNGTKSSKHASRDAEKHSDEELWYEEDERESFPQYCMTCEKQFVAKDDRFLYCSEECRNYDQEHGTTISTQHFVDSYANRSYSIYAAENTEPRDIIPRASPSRPSSTYFSPPSTPAKTSSTLPTTSSAIAALRSLSIRDHSPPSPTMVPGTTSGIWPFTTRSVAASPSSYARPSAAVFASTYDTGYYPSANTANYYATGSGTGTGHVTSSDRPLPPRRPGSYSRPKSIELVTPLIGQ